jgi:transcriptional regulator with XRE-family HTH domain
MFETLASDSAVLKELGERMRQRRVRAEVKQQELADRVGIARSTVSRIENGHPVQTPELIRYMRGVSLLGELDAFLPDLSESPLAKARAQRKQPAVARRVYRSKAEVKTVGKAEFVWPEDREKGQ